MSTTSLSRKVCVGGGGVVDESLESPLIRKACSPVKDPSGRMSCGT